MASFGGQATWANMTSPGGKLTALACHPTKKVNNAEELTYSLQTLEDVIYACKDQTRMEMSIIEKALNYNNEVLNIDKKRFIALAP